MRACYLGESCLGCKDCDETVLISEEELNTIYHLKRERDKNTRVVYMLDDLTDSEEITRPIPRWEIDLILDAINKA